MNVLLTATAETPVVERIWNLVEWLILSFKLSVNQSIVVNIAGAVFCMILAYLLGSICPAVLISKRFFNSDIRAYGSGNAGTYNAFCTYGRSCAIGIFLAEFLLGFVAIWVGRVIWGFNGAALASFFVVFGNIFPAFHKLRGGKGVATLFGAAFAIHPFIFALMVFVFLLAVLASKLVAFGSIAIALLFPLFVNAFSNAGLHVAMAVFCTGFLLYAHRTNIKLIQDSKERKFFFSEFFSKNQGE